MLLAVTGDGMSAGVLVAILVLLMLLFCSAMVSGTETAFFSLAPTQVHEMKTRNSKSDRAALKLLEMPKTLLATILISNNLINVAIVILSTYITASIFDFSRFPAWAAFLIQVVLLTSIILLLGDILPKIYSSQRNVQMARRMAGPMRIMLKLFLPLSSLLVKSTNLIDRRISRKSFPVSVDDLSDAIELTSDGTTPAEERKLLQGIVRFGDIEAREVMTPRMDVTAVDISLGFKELLATIVEAGYSRVPVYEGSPDQIRGILYIKDLLPHLDRGEDFGWQSLLRDAIFVPENKRISDLLKEFQDKKVHLAIVVDEYGGSSGIITLEDILEEIVGDISDEYDEPLEERHFARIDDHNYLFDGKIPLKDLSRVLGIGDEVFEEVKGEGGTLAGMILEMLQKMPEREEKIMFEGLVLTVKSVNKRRIERVQVTLPEASDSPSITTTSS